jgi:hypothetical protein
MAHLYDSRRRIRMVMVRRVVVVVRWVVMGVAEVGRRRREDVGEVGEEEERREADEEELRQVHGAARRGTAWLCCLGLRVSGLHPFRDAELGNEGDCR